MEMPPSWQVMGGGKREFHRAKDAKAAKSQRDAMTIAQPFMAGSGVNKMKKSREGRQKNRVGCPQWWPCASTGQWQFAVDKPGNGRNAEKSQRDFIIQPGVGAPVRRAQAPTPDGDREIIFTPTGFHPCWRGMIQPVPGRKIGGTITQGSAPAQPWAE
jgi:hypothetical protein